MNHFFTYLMWLQPVLARFDYFMRIDADLYLQNELPFDPFERLHRHGCAFGTGKESSDMAGCYEGQREATLAWARAQHSGGTNDVPRFPTAVSVANVEAARDNTVYWGGFHVGDVRFFRQTAHLAYAKHMNELGGMYTKRWSDQLHYPLAVQMFSEKYNWHESDSSGDGGENDDHGLGPGGAAAFRKQREQEQGEGGRGAQGGPAPADKRALCLMPELFNPEKASCHSRRKVKFHWGESMQEYCVPGSKSDIFLHEHRLGKRKDMWARCALK